MKKNITLALVAALACGSAFAVEPLPAYKPLDANNPISPIAFCADPTAVVYDGRVYIYGSNDQQEFDEGDPAENTYGKIKQLVCLSSADMINWTWHNPIKVTNVCSWAWNSWAPSIASREEADGKTHFYLYFCNGASGVGVMTATSPIGPWTDPVGKTFVHGGLPIGQVNWLFDPGVAIDDNGTGWLSFGGGGPNDTGTDAMPGNARLVKLGEDMLSFDSEFIVLPAPYHFEANELNFIGGKLVHSYSSNWAGGRPDWSSLGIDKPAPDVCSIAYMTSDDPLNPDSWEYQGDMIRGIGSYGWPGGNNHSHLQKVGDKYYMFYHMQGLSRAMGINGAFRSICVNEAKVNEEAVTVETINSDWKGVNPIVANVPQASERQEAEMIWNASGVKMNAASKKQTYVYKIQEGGWTAVKNVVHDGSELKSFTASLRGSGTLEVYLEKMEGEPIAVIDFASEGTKFHEYTVDTTKPFGKRRKVFFLFSNVSDNAAFDYWQFNAHDAGVQSVGTDATIVSQEYFTTSGVKVEHPTSGVYIVRNYMSDGTVTITKAAIKR